MTILCPSEFYAAVQHAAEADRALEAAIYHETDAKKKQKLEERRGQAQKTLLACFGYRANSDAITNKDPYMPLGTEIEYENGVHRYVTEEGCRRIVQETFIFSDPAPYSFFFREGWIDEITRKRVSVYDRVWYVFEDGTTKEEAESMSQEELDRKAIGPNCLRTFRADEAEKYAWKKAIMRETMRCRGNGMCGGIIYHPDYDEHGNRLPYGSWSTHT